MRRPRSSAGRAVENVRERVGSGEDSAGESRRRLRHRNGDVLDAGGEGYDGRSEAPDAIESLKRNRTVDTEE